MLDLALNRQPRRLVALAGHRLAASSRLVQLACLVALAVTNVFAAYEFTRGRRTIAIGLELLPILVLVAVLVIRRPALLVFGALALTMFGSTLNEQLPLGASALIYPQDIFVAAAVGIWVLQRTVGRYSRRPLRSPVLGPPFLFLSTTLLVGVLVGHHRWGLAFLSQPLRIVAYAAIAVAVADLTQREAYRWLVGLFYVDAGWQACLAAYHLATGTSQTSSAVSTGGTRPLALSTAMLLASALVLALLNLDRDWKAGRRALHLAVVAAATFGIAVSLGRTTFAAVAVLVPLLAFALPRMRRAVLSFAPLVLPVVAVAIVVTLHLVPSLARTLEARVTGQLSSDTALKGRQLKIDATLHGFPETPLIGFGFGRPVTYTAIDRSRLTITGDPENSYAWLLAGGGFLALSAWLGLFAVFVWDSFRRLRGALDIDRLLILWCMATWFSFSVNMLTGPILSVPSLLLPFWIALLLPSVLSSRDERSREHEPDESPLDRRVRATAAPHSQRHKSRSTF